MKKTKMMAILLAMTLALASCGQEGNKPEEKPEENIDEGENTGANELDIVPLEEVDIRTLNTESDLRQIVFGIYTEASKTGAKDLVESLKNSHAIANLTDENMENFLGAKYDIEEGIVSESMIGSRAYSMILIRAKSENDAEKLEKDIVKSMMKKIIYRRSAE